MDDDDIVFDRDTSAPKKKLKERKRRKGKANADENTTNLKKVLNNSDNAGDKNTNKNKDANSNKNKDTNTGKNKLTSDNKNLGKNNLNTNTNNDFKADKDKTLSNKDDLVNFNIIDSNILNQNDIYSQDNNLNTINNLNDKSVNMSSDALNKGLNTSNNDYDNDYLNNQNLSSRGNESLNNNKYAKTMENNYDYLNNKNSGGKNLSDYEAFLKEFNDAMKSGDKDRIILVLQKKIEYLEFNLNDLNLIIQHLRNDIHKKENVMHLLTDTNTNLQMSLNKFSKKLDEKILEASAKPKISKTSRSLTKLFGKKNNGMNKNASGRNIGNDEEKKSTELDNALAMNKILQKDNEKLKNLLNSYGNLDRMKELENMNKLLKEQNNNLNEELIKAKKEYVDHSYCEKKRNTLLEQVKYLTEENKRFKNDIKKLNITIEELNKTINELKINIKSNNINEKNETINNNKTQTKIILKTPRLPNISKNKKTIESENDKLKNKNEEKDEEIENLVDKDEIYILIRLFQGDENKYIEFRKKLIIYAKSKECTISKFKLEEKSLNKKVFSMQEQVEYLNHKVKESEMRIKIYQQQLNDRDYQNKKLKKRYNEEKKEKENTKQKLKDYKKKNEEIIMKHLKNKNNEENYEEQNINQDYEEEENENENE